MHAYAETYLPRAQKNLGEAFDYAVNACCLSTDEFMVRLIASGLAEEWESGSPRVLSGLSGTELARDASERTGDVRPWPPPQRCFDLSPAYWTGWALAHYQWWSMRRFREIAAVVPPSEIIGMYGPLHEESEDRFVDHMEKLFAARCTEPPLKRFRRIRNWSQTDLAAASGVNVRNIRQYEQNPQSIARAELRIVQSLARALACRIEDLAVPLVEETA